MICATVRENLPLLLHGFAVSIYPRKGTVTCRCLEYNDPILRFNLSPQGDGNTSVRK